MTPLVTTAWLAENLSRPDLVVVDASWYLPQAGRDPHTEYVKAHIPRAVFFDLDAISARDTPLPHMLPTPESFARDMGALGIGSTDKVVVYDGAGLFSAPRVWWMFRVFGHDAVAVLDGGLPKWKAEGGPLSGEPVRRHPATFEARFRPELLRTIDQMKANLTTEGAQVVDARSAGRFNGTEPEPRAGLRSGHIPGSFNVPVSSVVRSDGTLRPPEEIKALFANAGPDVSQPIVTTCGSGVTASVLALALETIGARNIPVYDGSWAEWGARADVPVET